MLTNLEWLADGQPYPPKAEEPRIEAYRRNERLFLTNHPEVWKADFERLARTLERPYREISTVFNYHQLLSKKTADFVCGKSPTIEYEGDTDALEQLLKDQRFNAKLYEAVIDISRFGNSVPKIVGDRLTMVSPKYWFPIVDRTDLKQITEHVIAYPTEPNAEGVPTRLYVEIHRVGSVEIREYLFLANAGTEGSKIGAPTGEPTVQKIGLDDFAVQPLTNATHSGSVYGLDDYAVINSLIEKLMWRIHCADIVLDKHSEPSMSGPASALSYDSRKGEYYLDLGNYFKRDLKDDPDVNYITWDGNLEANFKEIDLLFSQLYIISEMGAAFLEGSGSGGVSSGTALKLRMVSPRIKAQRLVGLNDSTLRNIIHLLGQANNIPVNANDLQLKWNDGLPDDPVEDANRRNVETGGKPTKSQFSAIKERGLSDDETEAELEQIRLESAASGLSLPDPTEETDPFPDDEAV